MARSAVYRINLCQQLTGSSGYVNTSHYVLWCKDDCADLIVYGTHQTPCKCKQSHLSRLAVFDLAVDYLRNRDPINLHWHQALNLQEPLLTSDMHDKATSVMQFDHRTALDMSIGLAEVDCKLFTKAC